MQFYNVSMVASKSSAGKVWYLLVFSRNIGAHVLAWKWLVVEKVLVLNTNVVHCSDGSSLIKIPETMATADWQTAWLHRLT